MRRANEATETAAVIIEAGEVLFSAHGVRGVSLREVAREAGVAVSSVSYHFGDKSGLLEAIYNRHTKPMNARRMELMAEARRLSDPSLRLKGILRAYLRPAFTLASDGAPSGGARFTRLRAVVGAEGDPVARRIVAEICDPVAQIFIDAMAECLPGVARTDIVWRAQFLLGSMYFMLTSPGRIDRLSGGEASGADHEATMEQLAATIHDSLMALIPAPRKAVSMAQA